MWRLWVCLCLCEQQQKKKYKKNYFIPPKLNDCALSLSFVALRIYIFMIFIFMLFFLLRDTKLFFYCMPHIVKNTHCHNYLRFIYHKHKLHIVCESDYKMNDMKINKIFVCCCCAEKRCAMKREISEIVNILISTIVLTQTARNLFNFIFIIVICLRQTSSIMPMRNFVNKYQ